MISVRIEGRNRAGEVVLQGTMGRLFGSREEAEAAIAGQLAGFDRSGRNEEEDYWWGRNFDWPRRMRFSIEEENSYLPGGG